jgi:hypothetical protein
VDLLIFYFFKGVCMFQTIRFSSLILVVLLFSGCGGGGGSGTPTQTHQAYVAGLAASDIKNMSDAEIQGLGTDIKFLIDPAIEALDNHTGNKNPIGQIESITPAQIAVLTPAQIRLIGATGPNSTVIGTAQIAYLSDTTWAALVSSSTQVAAITAAEIATLWDKHIVALGTNISFLSNSALVALDFHTGNNNPLGQIESILAAQIDVLTPAQVRLIGATGAGGTIGTSKIVYLNTGAWSALVGNPLQVAAITPAEVATLWDSQIVAFGANINSLTNPDLVALTCYVNLNGTNPVGQIESITATEIASLSPSQVRMIGAAGPGGTIGTSQLSCMNSGAWATLTSDPAQVAAITPQEVATFPDSFIPVFGTNINQFADLSLASLSIYVNLNGTNPAGQIESITAAEINALSPAQISILAGSTTSYGAATAIAYLNTGAFSVLSSLQTPVLTATNVLGVNATRLASLSTAALAALPSATRSSLTVTQKASLTAPQHTACGC